MSSNELLTDVWEEWNHITYAQLLEKIAACLNRDGGETSERVGLINSLKLGVIKSLSRME